MRPVPLLVLLGCLELVKEKKTHNLNATHALFLKVWWPHPFWGRTHPTKG